MADQSSPGSARAQILDAAVQVLREEGPTKLTQTRVAKAAGLRQGHLTYYFPHKTDLWIATAERAHKMLYQELGQFFESDGWPGAEAGHRAKMVSLVTHLVRDKQRTRLMLSLSLQADENEQLAAIFRETIDHSRRLIAMAFASSHPPAILELTLSVFWGLGIRHMLMDGHEDEDMTNTLVAELFGLLDK